MFEANPALRLPFDPVTLNYVRALRGVRPRPAGAGFIYGELGCGDAVRLILLASCNPEGMFFGFDGDAAVLEAAATHAERLGVRNVTFSIADIAQLQAAAADGTLAPQRFDYLVYNEPGSSATPSPADLQRLGSHFVKAGGCFVYRYRITTAGENDTTLFTRLTAQMLAEAPAQTEAFAKAWRGLASLYLSSKPEAMQAFDAALQAGEGLAWLRAQAMPENVANRDKTGLGKTLTVTNSFSQGGFSFLGQAAIVSNYMELATPHTAHAPLEAWRKHPLYEAIKDLAMGAAERIDIWGKPPLPHSDNLIALFGGFTYGTTESPERMARTVTYQGKSISFIGPLYDSILSLATVMPVTMGDLVTHESLKGIDALALLQNVQLLVACGLLQPMRASFEGNAAMDNPKLVGAYNQSLNEAVLDLRDYAFASTVIGRPVVYSGMQALVLQALHKGGLTELVNDLASQLIRLSPHPYLRPLQLHDAMRAQEESLRQVEAAFHNYMMRWFSLGILAAA